MAIDAAALGQRIAEARQRAELTQQDLAAEVDLDRSSLAKIETGRRRVTALELACIAEALDMRVEWFLDEAPAAIVSYRNTLDPGEPSPRIDAEIERRARAVEFLALHDQGFNEILRKLPAHRPPTAESAAERLAAEARKLMGVAQDDPLHDLAGKLAEIGVIAFVVDLGTETADAASTLLESGGAVAVINGDRKIGRRRLALAHELGHVLAADEYTVDWRVDTDADRDERAMDRFARALLLPRTELDRRWNCSRDAEPSELHASAVRIASRFRVDMSTLARRLLDLDLIDGAQAARVRAVKTTRADIAEFNLLVGEELTSGSLPREYVLPVLRLFRAEVISEVRALDLMFDAWTAQDLPQLPQSSESELWEFTS
jgi:Zn-dependent peptidase ImmA (M78 family)/transcriptional regulator with XRE-family HTH domain